MIDRGREDEEPGKIIEVTMVRTRSTSCVNDGGAGDDNDDNNSNHEGTPRKPRGVIGMRGDEEPGKPDDAADQVISSPLG